MTFDWKDGWLVTLGYALLVVTVGFLRAEQIELSRSAMLALGGAFMLSPSALRRAIWGRPKLGRQRTGCLFRLVSIVGLLLMFLGLGVAVIASVRLGHSREEPDFLAEELAYLEESSPLNERFAGGPALEHAEEAVEARRLARSADAEKEAHARAKERAAEWKASQQEQAEKTWMTSAVALVLLIFGSYLLSRRYERASVPGRASETSPSLGA